MASIGDAWGSIRGTLRNEFSFAEIKDIVGACGLPIHQLSHVQQKLSGGASKGQLMDQIDGLTSKLDSPARDRLVVACIEEMVARKETLFDSLETVLGRVGWGLSDAGVFPLKLQLDIETRTLGDFAKAGLGKCIRRYRDGDFDGAITAICGVVDKLTEDLYSQHQLGDHKKDSYQQRVVKSFGVLESAYRLPMDATKIDLDEKNKIWQNHKGAVNQSGYLLGAFRREYADVHGANNAPPELVQRALDCAVFLVRSITALVP